MNKGTLRSPCWCGQVNAREGNQVSRLEPHFPSARRARFIASQPKGSDPGGSDPWFHTTFRFFSGRERTGFPVAAKIAFITAGAITQMVGSPTPPQKS